MKRKLLLSLSLILLTGWMNSLAAKHRPPNFIVIFCDDLGYADLGCFGAEKIKTPHVDRMAAEGMRLTSFYSTSGVCTPSRSSLLTGCYPRRVGMHVNQKNLCVLFPADRKGLNPSETTIAETLKTKGVENLHLVMIDLVESAVAASLTTGSGTVGEEDLEVHMVVIKFLGDDYTVFQLAVFRNAAGIIPVSYTHLTLPTNREV